MALLCLCYCTWTGCASGDSLVAVYRLLIAVASLEAVHKLCGTQAPVAEARGLTSRGSPALEHGRNGCGVRP